MVSWQPMYNSERLTAKSQQNTPSKLIPWDSHGEWPLERRQALSTSLELLLQRRHWEGFHDGFCRLCLHLGLLAKHHPYTCLGGWLCAGLDAANAWDGEDAILLHFLSSNSHNAVDYLGASLLLQAVLSCERLCYGSLCHRLF